VIGAKQLSAYNIIRLLQIILPNFPFEWVEFLLSNPVSCYIKLKVLLEL